MEMGLVASGSTSLSLGGNWANWMIEAHCLRRAVQRCTALDCSSINISGTAIGVCDTSINAAPNVRFLCIFEV